VAREPGHPGVLLAGGSANVGSGNMSNPGGGNGPRSNSQGARVETPGSADFNPGAVTDQALATAAQDITAMSAPEVREFVGMLDLCTVNGHRADRQGKCKTASEHYRRKYGKDRAVDRAIAELERVVRFQKMFRATGAVTTEYEDNINKRLRGQAALALTTSMQSEQVKLHLKDERKP
jgi:hypothetical protein